MADPVYLLDTNILIYLIGGASLSLRARVEQQAPGTLVTSTLCVAEADFGLQDNAVARAAFGPLLSVVQPLPFDLPAAHRFAEMPFRRGKLDRFIAAHTLSLGLVLVTNNEADFADVPGLRIENWIQP